MAKKKRKRQHRTPVAPRIHSAPGTGSAATHPVGPEQTAAPAARGAGAPPPRPPRTTAGGRGRGPARRRRGRRRTQLVVGTVVALIVAAVVAQQVISRREAQAFNRIARAAGCGEVKKVDAPGAGEHLQEGERTRYRESPPTSGKHSPATLPAGVYEEPLSTDPTEDETIYKAVHSLEHGYVIAWHDGLSASDLRALERSYRNEPKVIVVPYPHLRGDDHMVLTAWGFALRCEEGSARVVDAFIERYREARTAPEPNQP